MPLAVVRRPVARLDFGSRRHRRPARRHRPRRLRLASSAGGGGGLERPGAAGSVHSSCTVFRAERIATADQLQPVRGPASGDAPPLVADVRSAIEAPDQLRDRCQINRHAVPRENNRPPAHLSSLVWTLVCSWPSSHGAARGWSAGPVLDSKSSGKWAKPASEDVGRCVA